MKWRHHMKTVGIIAEYNPLHNGHGYQLARAKELTGADYVIVILSGDFTQRGIPALIDKYTRTEMALCAGADLVLELPVCFATGSAEFFASGAVSLLDGLGVDYLCFGSESGDLETLEHISRILAAEPSDFKCSLSEHLQKGMSFPAARNLALEEHLASAGQNDAVSRIKNGLLEAANNILGVEYLKAMHRLDSTMQAVTLLREGSGYLDDTLAHGSFCSALAVRKWLLSGKDISALKPFLPESSLELLSKASSQNSLLSEDDFSSLLFYRLLALHSEGYTAFADVSQALSDKITGNLFSFQSWSQFCGILKSRDLTYTRISRCLLHILLDIRVQEKVAPYARILGFKEASKPLFGSLKSGKIPLIAKLADAGNLLSDTALSILEQDIFTAHVYDSIAAQKKGGPIQNEYRRQIIIK